MMKGHDISLTLMKNFNGGRGSLVTEFDEERILMMDIDEGHR
jgi:hypothetical protein